MMLRFDSQLLWVLNREPMVYVKVDSSQSSFFGSFDIHNGSITLIAIVINLVDPASSHMLISKIKPCMSKYKFLYNETANSSLKQL